MNINFQLATAGYCTAILVSLCGCGNHIERDIQVQDTGVRSSPYAVSGDLLLAASQKAAKDALESPTFNSFLEQYRKKSNRQSPLLKIGQVRNNTDDCNLQTSLVTTEIADALFRAGKLRVDGGTAHSRVFNTSREIKSANETRRESPALVLSGTLTSSRDGSDKSAYETTVLSVQIFDMDTGENVWRFSTSFGTKRTKPLMGK